jgi:hypothetical protein
VLLLVDVRLHQIRQWAQILLLLLLLQSINLRQG